MQRFSGKGALRILEYVLLVSGCLGLAVVARGMLPRLRAEQRVQTVAMRPAAATVQGQSTGKVIGKLEIPKVGLSTPVLEGCTSKTLAAGSCRLLETAQIGGLGTVGIAGHRDTDFRALAKVRAGDLILVRQTAGGSTETFRYRIEGARIVAPEEVDVLDRGERPELVLITCYPFHFLGSAPKRYVVEASLISADPSM